MLQLSRYAPPPRQQALKADSHRNGMSTPPEVQRAFVILNTQKGDKHLQHYNLLAEIVRHVPIESQIQKLMRGADKALQRFINAGEVRKNIPAKVEKAITQFKQSNGDKNQQLYDLSALIVREVPHPAQSQELLAEVATILETFVKQA